MKRYTDRQMTAYEVDMGMGRRRSDPGWDNGFRRMLGQESGCEEDGTMSDRASPPGSSDDGLSGESDALDDAREAALMRELLRAQEQHREGGVEPELADADEEPEPDA
ncbi:MAG TPA: hypothetical protein VK162_11125 [Streptosporangiaceae bacterium]|nr:hypothetical protein [Streptosporangiaceae bacterium]